MGTSVLIVDDHGPFRRFARALLQAEGFDVVGEAEDAASASARSAYRSRGPQPTAISKRLSVCACWPAITLTAAAPLWASRQRMTTRVVAPSAVANITRP
jgi:DNA-binding NarL/FixJ family response regulator